MFTDILSASIPSWVVLLKKPKHSHCYYWLIFVAKHSFNSLILFSYTLIHKSVRMHTVHPKCYCHGKAYMGLLNVWLIRFICLYWKERWMTVTVCKISTGEMGKQNYCPDSTLWLWATLSTLCYEQILSVLTTTKCAVKLLVHCKVPSTVFPDSLRNWVTCSK